jgi:hypothetical protein
MRELATLFLMTACVINTPARACFDNGDLQKIQMDQQRGTLIYVWSPRMVYSVQNMELAARAAAQAGLQFVALHDMRVPLSELPEALSTRQALCSEQLMGRDALRHFPTAFVITERGIHPHAIVGAMPWNAWVSSLDQRLKQP